MFKTGDIVICIDDKESVNVVFTPHLTLYKAYKIECVNVALHPGGYQLDIHDDSKITRGYRSERFISLREYRKRKILRCLSQETI